MMNLVPWKQSTSQDIAQFRKDFKSLLGRLIGDDLFSGMPFSEDGNWVPNVDLIEGKKSITVRAEIPGVEPKDLDISLDGSLLRIRGEKKQDKEEKDENYHRVERAYGFFARTVELPSEVEPDKVEAEYKKGVLTVKLRKTKESESKRIQIKAD